MRSSRSVVARVVGAVALAAALATTPASAAEPSLRIEPATIGAASGGSFSVQVVQDLTVATSGAQVTLDFDPAILQVQSVARGSAYQAAPIFVPLDMTESIRAANETGRLAQIAAAFTPPDAVAPGPAAFLVIRFRVVGCGHTALTLPDNGPFDAEVISGQHEGYGDPVPVSTVNGTVTTCVPPNAVTPDQPDPGSASPSPGLPILPIAAGGAALLAVIAAVAWRSRRPANPSHRVAG